MEHEIIRNRELELLSAILQATQAGRFRWEEDDDGSFSGRGGISAKIELKFPMLGDETVSGADLAALTVPGLEMTYFSGTEGMKLVQAILKAGLSQWNDHLSPIEAKIEALIEKVEAHPKN